MAGGLDAHRRGDLAAAERIYREILRRSVEYAPALHYLGILLHQREHSEAAVQHVQRAAALEPGHAVWANDLGNVHSERGELAAAANAFRHALELGGDDATVWNNLGAVLERAGRDAEAEHAYRSAIACDGEFAAGLNNLSRLLANLRRPHEAAEFAARAYALPPHEGKSPEMLGLAYCRLGRIGEAVDAYRRWCQAEPDNPAAAHLYAAVSRTGVPARAADAYVEQIFDAFAANFEDKMMGTLGYRGPQLIEGAVARLFAPSPSLDILDAGCGTGLCGEALRRYARHLVGVDLSQGMLDVARRREVYGELVKSELTAFLATRPAAFDLVVLADTLIYFGGLEPVLAGTHAALRPGGVVIFTVELPDEATAADGFDIAPHGRYRHDRGYVEAVLARCGFALLSAEAEILREEHAQPVAGLVVAAGRR